MSDVAEVHVAITRHAQHRLAQRVTHLTGGMGSAKQWVRESVRDAAERNGFSRSQPEWVKRKWCQSEPAPRGSNVRYVRSSIGDDRFCIVVGYEKSSRKSDPPRWNVITVLPESDLWERGLL